MKRIYVKENRCLGCHLCEYYCAFANSGKRDMATALKNKKIYPRITVEEGKDINFAVNCRHCKEPICVMSCISGALSRTDGGAVVIDTEKCVGCYTCVLVCPYGAILPSENGPATKCELCANNTAGAPACVGKCPNEAIVYEERE